MQHPQKQKEPSEKYTLRSPHRCCHIHILELSSVWLSEQNMIFEIFFIFLFSLFIHFHNLLLHLIHFLLNSLNYYCHCFYFCFFFSLVFTKRCFASFSTLPFCWEFFFVSLGLFNCWQQQQTRQAKKSSSKSKQNPLYFYFIRQRRRRWQDKAKQLKDVDCIFCVVCN